MGVLGNLKRYSTVLAVVLAFYSVNAHAQLDSNGVLDTVMNKFYSAVHGWGSAIQNAANFMFWTLTAISMVWTFGLMALRKADIGEFFAEFAKFTIFTGFFNWLLKNGSGFATDIINSMRQLGTSAGGLTGVTSPSDIVDIGFQIFSRVISASSAWSPIQSGCGILISAVILVVLALVAVNMLLLIVTGWFLSFAGIFYLGFGGSRWTSDMAIGYFKTVLGVGAQLMAMILLVSVGQGIINEFYGKIGGLDLRDLGVMLVVSAALLALVNKVPSQFAGMVGGGSASHAGAGAGAALAAAGVGAAAMATGGAVAMAGLKSMGGGASAVMAAISKASENMASGSGMFSGMGGGGESSGSGGSSIASAMGGAGSGSDAAPIPSSGNSGSGGGSSSGSSSGSSDSGAEGQQSSGAGVDSGSGGGESSGGQSASGGGGGGEGGSEQASSDKPRSTARQAASIVGRFAADTANNLAKGSAGVAMDKISGAVDAYKKAIAPTIGGQIAQKIAGAGATAANAAGTAADTAKSSMPSFDQNSLSASNDTKVDRDAEKAAFQKRSNGA